MTTRYTFTHFNADKDNGPYPAAASTTKTFEFGEDQMDPWTTVLYEFTNFLSGVYGYNISEQVFVQDFDGEKYPVSQAMG